MHVAGPVAMDRSFAIQFRNVQTPQIGRAADSLQNRSFAQLDWYGHGPRTNLRMPAPYIRPISARSGERPLAVISMPPPTSCTLPTSISSPSVGAGPLFALRTAAQGVLGIRPRPASPESSKNRVERKRNEAFITRSGICSRKKIGRFKSVVRSKGQLPVPKRVVFCT